MSTRRAASAFAPVLLVGLLAACGGEAGGMPDGGGAAGASRPEGPWNVLVIVVDTLRADHLGCYGHARPTSPAIDGLSASGVTFERAYSAAPWTMPAVASMLTGLPPAAHRVESMQHLLSGEVTTLAERLTERGYLTAAVVSHLLISSRFGFDEGFQLFSEREAQGHDHVSTPGVTEIASTLLRLFSRDDQPFFLFVHYFDPHFNYKPNDLYDFAPPSVGTLDGTQGIEELRARLDTLTPAEFAFLADLYDEEIRLTDDGVGVLLQQLRDLGIEDRTLVVFTSDHGEEFGERGWLGHVRSLHDELVRVPLIVRRPDEPSAGARVAAPVSTISLTPTVLDLLGIATPAGTFPVPPLRAWLDDPRAPAAGPVYSAVAMDRGIEDDPLRTHLSGVVAWPHKLVRDERTGSLSLYDLPADPGEVRDLAAARQGLARSLAGRLDAWAEQAALLAHRRAVGALTPEEEASLRSLGYLGR